MRKPLCCNEASARKPWHRKPARASTRRRAQDASALRSGPVSVPSGSRGVRDRLDPSTSAWGAPFVQISAMNAISSPPPHSIFPFHRRLASHVPYASLVELRAAYVPDAAARQSHAIPGAFPGGRVTPASDIAQSDFETAFWETWLHRQGHVAELASRQAASWEGVAREADAAPESEPGSQGLPAG